MTQIILDTNFIIYCVKQKIYFDEQIQELIEGAEIIVPKEVREELRKMSEDKDKKYRLEDRELASLSLQIIEKYKEVRLGAKYVDKGIIDYSRKNKEVIVATMDARLIQALGERIKTARIRGLKRISIE